jgi:hypothetical protein
MPTALGPAARAQQVGDHTGEQGADGFAVAPQPVHADRRRSPAGMGHVADGGQQGGVDHGGAGPEQRRPSRPGPKAADGRDQPDRHGLGPHAGRDQPLASHPVRQSLVIKLPNPPDGRVEGGQDADAADRQAVAGEQQREDAPGEAVVEVVDHAGLAGRGQGLLLEAGKQEDLPGGQALVGSGRGVDVGGGLMFGEGAGLAHQQGRQAKAEAGVGKAEEERLRAQPRVGGDEPGGKRGDGDRHSRRPR